MVLPGQLRQEEGRTIATWLFVFAMLVVLASQCILSMRLKSATYDEPFYMTAGLAYLTAGRFDLNQDHPPLMKYLIGAPLLFLEASPPAEMPLWDHAAADRAAFGVAFLYGNRVDADTLLFAARLPTVLSSMLLGLLVWRWARDLYGSEAGSAALVLYVFCPNILAHSRYAALDLGVSAGICAACLCLWHLYRSPSVGFVVLAGTALAVALLMKHVGVLVVGLLPVFLLGACLHHRSEPTVPEVSPAATGPTRPSPGRLTIVTAATLLVTTVVITCAYGPSRFGLTEYLASFHLGVLRRGELVVPDYESFLWGRYSTTGFRLYYLAAFLLKTPIPTLVLTVLTVVRLATRRDGRWFDELFLVAPIVALMLVTMFLQTNLGIRYILPIYPLLFVLLAGTASVIWRRAAGGKVVLLVLGGWYVASAVRAHPDYLPYFNELIGDRSNAIRYLDDSNIDWGEDLKPLARYAAERRLEPLRVVYYPLYFQTRAASYYGLRYGRMSLQEIAEPQPGWYAISAQLLQRPNLVGNVRFDWLDRFEPEVVIGHSIYLYHFD